MKAVIQRVNHASVTVGGEVVGAIARGIAVLVGFGKDDDAGKLAPLADLCFRVPSDETPRIQEGHEFIGHLLCGLLEQEMFPK